MLNAMSVDIEDLYQIYAGRGYKCAYEHSPYIEDSTDKILQLFKKYKTKATFFIVGSVAKKNRLLLKKIAEEGHEIGSHGYFHRYVFDMTPEGSKSNA